MQVLGRKAIRSYPSINPMGYDDYFHGNMSIGEIAWMLWELACFLIGFNALSTRVNRYLVLQTWSRTMVWEFIASKDETTAIILLSRNSIKLPYKSISLYLYKFSSQTTSEKCVCKVDGSKCWSFKLREQVNIQCSTTIGDQYQTFSKAQKKDGKRLRFGKTVERGFCIFFWTL